LVENRKLGTYNINLAFGGMYPGNPLDEEIVSDCVLQILSDNLPVTCILKASKAASARVPQHVLGPLMGVQISSRGSGCSMNKGHRLRLFVNKAKFRNVAIRSAKRFLISMSAVRS
jgi:hypothetical protein